MRKLTINCSVTFGKYAGLTVRQVQLKDKGYYKWMIENKVVEIVEELPSLEQMVTRAKRSAVADDKWVKGIKPCKNVKPEDFDDIGLEWNSNQNMSNSQAGRLNISKSSNSFQ
jgi:hypothetical protein